MKSLLFCILLFFSISASAQVFISGQVKNEKQEPLEMANIIVMYESGQFATYGTTDTQGKYRLKLKSATKYLLKVSYVGMKTANQWITTTDKNIVQDFKLIIDNTLAEVNVIHKMPVRVVGDTIIYNADSFALGTEKKLGDVLKTLPGVEVDDNGGVKVEGKDVKKVMVEGKDFFEGDTKLATKNIPANAVDKVQVLRNFADNQQMKNVTDNSDNVALNIKLKEGKKNFWFGDITAGAGNDKKYFEHANLFYYSPKYSVGIINDLNNVGEQSFTFSDYFRFTGGLKSLNKSSSFQLSPDIAFLLNKNDKVKSMSSQFGAGNFNYTPNKKWDISGFAIYSGLKTRTQEASNKHYFQSAKRQAIDEYVENRDRKRSRLGLAKISAAYQINTANQLNYEIMGKLSKGNSHELTQSSISQAVKQESELESYSVKQYLEYYSTLGDRHILAFEAQHEMQKNNPFYDAMLQQFAFTDFMELDASQPQINIRQEEVLKSQNIQAKLDYYYLLNKKNNLNFTLGTSYNWQNFNSSIFQILEKGEERMVTAPKLSNDVEYAIADNYIGLHYRFLAGKFEFNQGGSLHCYGTKDTQFREVSKKYFYRFVPDISVKFSIRKSESLYLNYTMTNNFTDIKKRAEGYVLGNYNYLFGGNRNLQHATNHYVSLSYHNFDAFNFSNTNVRISYSRSADAIRNSSFIDGVNRISSAENNPFDNESWHFSGRFEKRFRGVKWSLEARGDYSKRFEKLMLGDKASENIKNISIGQYYHTTLSTNFKNAPNFDFGYRISINHYRQKGFNERYIKHSPYAKLNVYLWNRLLINAKYTYNHYSNSQRKINSYDFLNASVSYQKPDSAWEFILQGENLLNTKSLNTNFGNSYLNSYSQYFIQGRMVLLKVAYKL